MADCQIDELYELANDEEIFKPRKKRVSEFKTLPWPKQMYAIQRYLESGMYPYFVVGISIQKYKKRLQVDGEGSLHHGQGETSTQKTCQIKEMRRWQIRQ